MGIQPLPEGSDTQAQDAHDAEQLFRLLEQEVVPLFYQRISMESRGMASHCQREIKRFAPRFCTKRMVKREHMRQLYAPATAHPPEQMVT